MSLLFAFALLLYPPQAASEGTADPLDDLIEEKPAVPPVAAPPQDPPAGPEKFDLLWKFEKGEVLRYRMSHKTSLDWGGMAIHQETGTVYSMAVKDVDAAGQATLSVTYDAVSLKLTALDEEFDYDSRRNKTPSGPPAARILSRMVGRSFTLKITPEGRIAEVSGLDEIMKSLPRQDQDDPTFNVQMVGKMFTNDAYQSLFQQMWPPLPMKKVSPGDEWSGEFTVKVPYLGTMIFTQNCHLSGIDDQNASIDHDMTIQPKEDDGSPLPVEVDIKEITGASQTVFSIARGRFLNSRTAVDFTLEADGQEMPVHSEVESSLLPEEPVKEPKGS